MSAGCALISLRKAESIPVPVESILNIEATSTADVVSPEPVRWDVKNIDVIDESFVPPKGYWVYHVPGRDLYWLVRGEVPTPGSENPFDTALAHRVATIAPAVWYRESFPTWDGFEIAMAQFDCMEGNTEDTAVYCPDVKPKIDSAKKTLLHDPYRSFTLSAVHRKTSAPAGNRSYIMLRQGTEGEYGILFRILDESATQSVLDLVDSMKTGIAPTVDLVEEAESSSTSMNQ